MVEAWMAGLGRSSALLVAYTCLCDDVGTEDCFWSGGLPSESA